MKLNRLLIVILLLSFTGHHADSQRLVVGFSAGMGSYSMADLKLLNEYVKPSFDCKLVSDFPPYMNYRFSLNLNDEEYSFGVFYTYQSTGSRISAKDYSGEYYFDQQVHSNNVGFYWAMNFLSRNNFQLSVYAKPEIVFSKLGLSEYFTILDTVFTDVKVSCTAISFCLEPGIEFSYRVLSSVSIGVNAGYSLQMGGQNFHLPGSKESILVIQDTGNEVMPNWSGFRFGISVMYNIKLKDRENNKIE